MTNFEKYRKDIEKAGYRFGYDIKTNKIIKCDLMNCHDCEFNSVNNYDCRYKQVKWLYEEYVALSDAEINLINTLEEMTGVTYEFITRDCGGIISFYTKIPIAKVGEDGKRYLDQKDCMNISDRTKKLFPNIQYEDGIYDITEGCFIEE